MYAKFWNNLYSGECVAHVVGIFLWWYAAFPFSKRGPCYELAKYFSFFFKDTSRFVLRFNEFELPEWKVRRQFKDVA